MPNITNKRIGVAVDMFGCPNRCRHCYLGPAPPNGRMPDDDLRWVAKQFRDYFHHTDTSVGISSAFREPDFSDEYRRLHELEKELSDGDPVRYELLSTWRLARDKDYSAWAKSVGPQTCQITFFGMEETTDWFYRRKGAFQDALTATERLLEAGMKPRWQIFLTRKLIPEIDDLLRLIDRLRLRERVQELGGEFQLFMHAPGSIGEGFRIEYLRPTLEEVANLPEDILAASRKHLKTDLLWQSESELFRDVAAREVMPTLPSELWFLVTNNLDVFSNAGTLNPWWRLGNLKMDSVETVVRRFEQDEVPGLQILLHYPQSSLAQEYGDPQGSRIFTSRSDLIDLYHARHCAKSWQK